VPEVIHQTNPNMLSDSEFVSGTLPYVVPGNEGRLLDPRRTPVRIVTVDESSGYFVLEIMAFEDKGARWEVPLEDVSRFQFHRRSRQAGAADVKRYSEVVHRLDRPMHIPCSAEQRAATSHMLADLRREVSDWLDAHSEFLKSGEDLDFTSRAGIPSLYRDCERLMKSRHLHEMDVAFAEQFVSNPHSGELVKGHRIVLADLGLVEYHGKIVRNPAIFDGNWTKARRAQHLLVRLAFMREVFGRIGKETITMYRGLATVSDYRPVRNMSFVSATFNLDVAMSMFSAAAETRNGALYRQHIGVDRLFMTYLESRPLNRHFKESEAILLHGDHASFL
jgi:hypothetical protein